jgi:hypothetical protein
MGDATREARRIGGVQRSVGRVEGVTRLRLAPCDAGASIQRVLPQLLHEYSAWRTAELLLRPTQARCGAAEAQELLIA